MHDHDFEHYGTVEAYLFVIKMPARILLVNPWICDFAAYDLWMYPLGLLRVASHFSADAVQLAMLNFLERPRCAPGESVAAAYGTGRFAKERMPSPDTVREVPRHFFRYGISEAQARERLKDFSPDCILLTSMMTYWYVGVQHTIALLKRCFPDCPIVLGGIYPTLAYEHACAHSGADAVVAGSDMTQIRAVLTRVCPKKIIFNDAASGDYRYELLASTSVLPLRVSTGCPFRCSYCASARLAPEFKQMAWNEALARIEHCVRRYGAMDLVFYDDALLVNADAFIKPLLRALIERRVPVRFHTPNGLHARYIDAELAGLMRHAGFKTVRVSLESSDAGFQKQHSADKVSNADFERAIACLRGAGFAKSEVGVYTLAGMPGQKRDAIERDMRYVYDVGAHISLSSYALVPGSADWRYMIEAGIVPADVDLLRLSHTAFPLLYGGFSEPEMRQLRKISAAYNRLV